LSLLERCEAIMHVDSLQPPFSLIRRDAAAREIPWCAEHGTGVICYSPMQSGLLTDSFTAERIANMAEDDWRRRSPEFLEPKLSRNLALRDSLRPIAQRYNTTVSSIAVGWVNAWPGVTAAIVGARSPLQVDGWIAAGNIELTVADLEEIANAIERTGGGTGPTMPQLHHV
jgi:aryl-alcohol dehydrogenase-like predicted oxidoreductase